MIGILNVLGVIALIVGVVLWVLMLKTGLSNLRKEPKPSGNTPPSDKGAVQETPAETRPPQQ